MEGFSRWWRQRKVVAIRVKRGQDPELAQSVTRVAILIIALAYCLVRAIAGPPAFLRMAAAVGVYAACSIPHLAWVLARPGASRLRRVLGIVGDQCTCTACFLIGGEFALGAFVVYIWSSIANGMRFGWRYMYLATALGVAGFGSAVVYHGWTTLHGELVIGIYVTMIALPLFVRRLSVQLERAHHMLKRQASALEFQATHDRLTGLANRAVFFDALQRVIARSQREPTHCAVVFFDVDGFKSINDNYGHQVGDHWLQRMAAAVAAKIRRGDLFCRLAGDEFVILTEHAASEDAALRIADMIQETVRSLDEVDGYPVATSASIGIALYPSALRAESASSVAHRADMAMYSSKRSGRGRCTVHAPGLAFPDSELQTTRAGNPPKVTLH